MKTNPVPISVKFSVGSMVEVSPCRRCRHHLIGVEAHVCITWDECPLRIQREPLYAFIDDRAKNRHPGGLQGGVMSQRHECPFDGCKIRTIQEACYQHRRTVARRRALGVKGPELYWAGNGGPKKEETWTGRSTDNARQTK